MTRLSESGKLDIEYLNSLKPEGTPISASQIKYIQSYASTLAQEAERKGRIDELNLLSHYHLSTIEIDVFGRGERDYQDRLATLTAEEGKT